MNQPKTKQTVAMLVGKFSRTGDALTCGPAKGIVKVRPFEYLIEYPRHQPKEKASLEDLPTHLLKPMKSPPANLSLTNPKILNHHTYQQHANMIQYANTLFSIRREEHSQTISLWEQHIAIALVTTFRQKLGGSYTLGLYRRGRCEDEAQPFIGIGCESLPSLEVRIEIRELINRLCYHHEHGSLPVDIRKGSIRPL